MKRLLLLFIITIPYVINLTAGNYVRVCGSFKGQNIPSKLQLVTAKNGRPYVFSETTVSEKNSFGFLLETSSEDPIYYLHYDNKYFRIALLPGDDIIVNNDNGNWSFEKFGNGINNSLERWSDLQSSLTENISTKTYGQFFFRFDSVCNVLKTWNLKSIVRKGNVNIDRIINLDLLWNFVSFISKYQQDYQSEEQNSKYYHSIMKNLPPACNYLLEQVYGIALLNKYFNYKQEFIYRGQLYTLDMQLLELPSPELKSEYILEKAPRSIEDFNVYENRYINLLMNEEYKIRMRHLEKRPKSILKKGEVAANFLYPDMSGAYKSIQNYKGYYIYIDLWATWCAPCKREIPYLKKIEEKYRNKKIKFISISIDEKKEKWISYLSKNRLGGIQLWAGDWKELPAELEIGSIPRFILIDPNGRWRDVNAPRPSDPNLEKLLDNLLE